MINMAAYAHQSMALANPPSRHQNKQSVGRIRVTILVNRIWTSFVSSIPKRKPNTSAKIANNSYAPNASSPSTRGTR